MRLILNTVNAAEAGKDRSRTWVVQTGLIADLDCSLPTDALIAALEVEGCPQYGQALSATRPDLLAKQFLVRPGSGAHLAVLRIVYQTERLIGAPPVERFSVEDTTNLSSGTTQLLPFDLTPLRVTYTSPGASTPDIEDTLSLSYPLPMRSIVMYGLFSSRPSGSLQTQIRRVNDNMWEGFPAGYWLYSGIRVRFSDIDEMYAVTCTVTSKCCEDWSQYAVLRGPDGRYVKVDPAVTAGLNAQAYAFGIRKQDEGILKVGMFRTTNFMSLFGNI